MSESPYKLLEFFEAYCVYDTTLRNEIISEDLVCYKKLFADYVAVDALVQEHKRTESPDYNIFELLRLTRYEAKVHTPFLQNLLHPTATHAQGALFLRFWIQRLFPLLEEDKINHVKVFKEYFTGGYGNIDLYITFTCQGKLHQLIIENKIDAIDQPYQLKRYWEFANQQAQNESTIRIVYLTKYGASPDFDISIPKDLFDKLQQQEILHLWSYTYDIVFWLEGVLPAVASLSVKHMIEQYISAIKEL